MRSRSLLVLTFAMLALLAGAVSALAASAGSTFLVGGLPLPAGALPGGGGGYSGGEPGQLSVSTTGRYVAFAADADLLDPSANLDVSNIFRKDRLTGEVLLVSRATGASGAVADADGAEAAISADGSRVAWRTDAALDPADTDRTSDVYVRDIPSGTTFLASQWTDGRQTTDDMEGFDLSGNGRFVVFATADALAGADDANGDLDVYVRDLQGGTTTLVSRKALARTAANDSSRDPAISDDGRWVTFATLASDVVSGFDPGGHPQVVARDTVGGTAYAVSNQSGGLTPSNGDASEPTVAGAPAAVNTVTVAYTSEATNLDGADATGDRSVFRRRLADAGSTLVSRADGAGGANADSRAHTPSISDDGRLVVFDSDAGNLGAGADSYGTYVRDVGASRTALASSDNRYAVEGQISGDGGTIAWLDGGELVPLTPDGDPDLPGVFARSYVAPTTLGTPASVSRPPGSAPFLAPVFEVPDADSGQRTMSADGRYVVFAAGTSHLPGGRGQLYRRDLLTGATDLVSRADGPNGAAAADGFSQGPSISADGMRVAFDTSASNLAPGHAGAARQVYVRDLAAATTTLVSRASDGSPADQSASQARMTADGRHVVFVSQAGNLGAGAAGTDHVYLRDLVSGQTQLVDRASGADGAIGNAAAEDPSVSADGRLVAFAGNATNLNPDDADPDSDVYVRDTVAQTTILVSRRSGAGGQHARGSSLEPSISTDGAVVAFRAQDETLAPEGGPWGGDEQIVARTLATAQNALVSRAPSGAAASEAAGQAAVDGDGSVIAFRSDAPNLLPGLGGGGKDAVFARTMATGALSGPPAFGLLTNGSFGAGDPSLSDDGQCLLFAARGHNAVTGFAGDFRTLYMYVVSGVCPKPLPIVAPGRRRATPRPRLSKVSLSHKRFRVGRRATARVAVAPAGPNASAAAKRKVRRARRAPVGTTFRLTLNTRANVAIAIERQVPGRLVGRFCKRPARRLRRHLRCVRWVRAGRLSRGGLNAGAQRIAFSGRISRKALKPGRYRARLRASSVGGTSSWATLKFAVVRR
jgi:Tol biopolymer transport system component